MNAVFIVGCFGLAFSFLTSERAPCLTPGIHFPSARHNRLKSQENIAERFHCRAANESKAPWAWNNHSGGTRRRDQKWAVSAPARVCSAALPPAGGQTPSVLRGPLCEWQMTNVAAHKTVPRQCERRWTTDGNYKKKSENAAASR